MKWAAYLHEREDRHALCARGRCAPWLTRQIPADMTKARALQDAINVEQPGGPGKFEVPNWDPVSQKKIREALLVLATTVTDTSKAFGTKDQVDPVQRLIGAASAWGANPPKDATYLNCVPEKNDGKTIYKMTVKDVPVDGFWSVSLYNAKVSQKNQFDAYTLNNITSKKGPDGSVAGLELHGAALSPAC